MKKLYKVEKLLVFMVAADYEYDAEIYVDYNLEYLTGNCDAKQPPAEATETCEDISLPLEWSGLVPYSVEEGDQDMSFCEQYFD